MKRVMAFLFLVHSFSWSLNPVKDVCWSCIFPISIGGKKVTQGEDSPCGEKVAFKVCPKKIGGVVVPTPCVPVSFWEPIQLIEVVRKPGNLVSLGIKLALPGHSYGGHQAGGSLHHSFYHVHFYHYPLLALFDLFKGFTCLERGTFDLPYISEVDPTWVSDETNMIMNPDVFLFSNPLAQSACMGECVKTSTGFGVESLFWCGGCQGSLYPLTGSVASHVSGVQASLLIAQRLLARMHRAFQLHDTCSNACGSVVTPLFKKTQYKLQMVYPKPVMQCAPLGRSEIPWQSFKEFPYQGEDFVYLVFRKRSCCLASFTSS